jgi:hypothetical protein
MYRLFERSESPPTGGVCNGLVRAGIPKDTDPHRQALAAAFALPDVPPMFGQLALLGAVPWAGVDDAAGGVVVDGSEVWA